MVGGGEIRALKRRASRLGLQLRRQSVQCLCCVSSGYGLSRRVLGFSSYQRLVRSPSVADSECLLIEGGGGGGGSSPVAFPRPFVGFGSGFSCGDETEETVAVKVGMVGDCQTGKTSFMVNYASSQKIDDYEPTVGMTAMGKTCNIQNANIAFNIWDLGGHRQFTGMMPLLCKDADAILLVFDLTRRSTLHSLKQWFVQARHCNKSAILVLIGTKFDHFVNLHEDTQRIITRQARLYAQAMDASLFFSSVTHNINVHKIFKVIVAKLFDLPCNIPKNLTVGEPIIDY